MVAVVHQHESQDSNYAPLSHQSGRIYRRWALAWEGTLSFLLEEEQQELTTTKLLPMRDFLLLSAGLHPKYYNPAQILLQLTMNQ